MNFMNCSTCGGVAQTNASGICLSCQRGFVGIPQEDAWVNSPEREMVKLEERKKELENALQKPETKKLPVRKLAGRRQRVRKTHSEGKETSKEGHEDSTKK